MTELRVVTYNTESGCRPGFHEHLQSFIVTKQPDVIALQEVHVAKKFDVPDTYMPEKPGKRIYPQRLRLLQELHKLYSDEYEFIFTPHINGLHDCERGPHQVAFCQVTMVRRKTWSISYVRRGLVFGSKYSFNTEHELAEGGAPSSKAAITVLITDVTKRHKVVVSNVHGLWWSRGKIDVPERFAQNLGIARQIEEVLEWEDTPYVLCVGDLNYRSDMVALGHLQGQPVFGSNGKVLNRAWGVSRTRTDHYLNWEKEPEADFMIASNELAQKALYLKAYLDSPSDHALFEGVFVL